MITAVSLFFKSSGH